MDEKAKASNGERGSFAWSCWFETEGGKVPGSVFSSSAAPANGVSGPGSSLGPVVSLWSARALDACFTGLDSTCPVAEAVLGWTYRLSMSVAAAAEAATPGGATGKEEEEEGGSSLDRTGVPEGAREVLDVLAGFGGGVEDGGQEDEIGLSVKRKDEVCVSGNDIVTLGRMRSRAVWAALVADGIAELPSEGCLTTCPAGGPGPLADWSGNWPWPASGRARKRHLLRCCFKPRKILKQPGHWPSFERGARNFRICLAWFFRSSAS